jgi:hypothetical protein
MWMCGEGGRGCVADVKVAACESIRRTLEQLVAWSLNRSASCHCAAPSFLDVDARADASVRRVACAAVPFRSFFFSSFLLLHVERRLGTDLTPLRAPVACAAPFAANIMLGRRFRVRVTKGVDTPLLVRYVEALFVGCSGQSVQRVKR